MWLDNQADIHQDLRQRMSGVCDGRNLSLTRQLGALFCTAMHRLNAFHKVCFLEEELNQEDSTLLLAVDVHR